MQPQNKMFAHYQILQKIGQGGMGAVYKVLDTKLQRVVALKVMIQNPHDKVQSQRFIDEIKAVATLNHDNIVRLFDAGTYPSYYFTMEYIEGNTLDKVVENLSIKQTIEIFQKVANALYHAHCKGFIHRDVKPGNIIINSSLEPKVTDFGLAKNIRIDQSLSQTGEIIGTPKYVSPEQVLTGNIDKRSDIFSLGITMYEVFAKKYPFNYEEQNICATLLYKIIHQDPPPLSQTNKEIDTSLSTICHTCIHKDPNKRYSNMKVLSRDLERYLIGQPIKASSDSALSFFLQLIVKNKITSILFFVLLALLLVRATITKPQIKIDKNKDFPKQQLTSIELPVVKLELTLQSYEAKSDSSAFEKAHLHYQKSLGGIYDIDSLIKIYKEQQLDSSVADEAFYQEAYMYIINGDFTNGYWENERIQEIYLRAESKVGTKSLLDSDLMTFYQIWAYSTSKKENKNKKMEFVPAHNAFGYWFYSMIVEDVWEKEKSLLQAISLRNEVRFFNDLALLYDQQGLPEEQLAISLHGLKLFPSTVLLHYFATRAYIEIKDYDSAQEHLDFIIKYYNGNIKYRAYYEQARIYILTKNIQGARSSLVKAKSYIENHEKKELDFYMVWEEVLEACETGKYTNRVENTLANNLHRIRLFKEVEMFSFIHSELSRLEYDNNDGVNRDVLLAYIAELNSLNFKTLDADVRDLWLKIHNQIYFKLARQPKVNASVFWIRKLLYIICNASDCNELKQYSIVWTERDELDRYLPDDAKKYYFYYKAMGDLAYSRLNFRVAAQFYDRAYYMAPWFSELENWRDFSVAKYLFYEKGDRGKAHDIVNKILVRNPPFCPSYTLEGIYYAINNKNFEKAQYFFDKARESFFIKVRDRKDLEYDYGVMLKMMGKHEEAIKCYSHYIEMTPSHPFGFSGRGASYQALGQYENALKDFNEAVILDEDRDNPNKKADFVRSYQTRAFLYEVWGDETENREKKQELYQKALNDWISCAPVQESEKEKANSIARLQEKLKK